MNQTIKKHIADYAVASEWHDKYRDRRDRICSHPGYIATRGIHVFDKRAIRSLRVSPLVVELPNEDREHSQLYVFTPEGMRYVVTPALQAARAALAKSDDREAALEATLKAIEEATQ